MMDTIKRRVKMIDVNAVKPWPSMFIYDIIYKFEDGEELTLDELYEAYSHYVWLIESDQKSALEFETLNEIFR